METNTLTASQKLIKSSNFSIHLVLLFFKSVSLLLNGFFFYSVIAKSQPNQNYELNIFDTVFILNAAGVLAALVGGVLDYVKGNGAKYKNAQLAKGDTKGLKNWTVINYALIAVSVGATTYNGLTYVQYETYKYKAELIEAIEQKNADNLQQRDNIQQSINTNQQNIAALQAENKKENYVNDKGLEVKKPLWMFRTNDNKIAEYSKSNDALNVQLASINNYIAPIHDEILQIKNSQPKIFPAFYNIQLPIILAFCFALFLEFLIYNSQHSISFVHELFVNNEDESTNKIETVTSCHTAQSLDSRSITVNNHEQSDSVHELTVNAYCEVKDDRIAVNSVETVINLINSGNLPSDAASILKSEVYLVKKGLAYKAVNRLRAQEQAKQKDVLKKSMSKNDIPSSNIILLPNYK